MGNKRRYARQVVNRLAQRLTGINFLCGRSRKRKRHKGDNR